MILSNAINRELCPLWPAIYDGDCNLTPDTGYFTNTTYSIWCAGAHGEGNRITRDPTVDYKEPMVYEYTTNVMSIILDRPKSFSVKLFQGSQGSASVRLPVGQAFNNYEVNVSVNLKDRYGDFITVYPPFARVLPDPATVPTNGNDTAAVSAFMDSFSETYNVFKAGGDPLAVVQFLGSTSLALVSTKFDEGPVSDSTTSIIEDFVNQLNHAVPEPDSDEMLTVDQVASLQDSLMMMTSNPSYVSTNTSVMAIDSTLKLNQHQLKLTTKVPFPVEDWKDANKTCGNSVILLSFSLPSLLPPKTVSPDEITLEQMRTELHYQWSYEDLSADELIRREDEVVAIYNERQQHQGIVIEKEINKEAVQAVVKSVSTILKVQAAFVQVGEEPNVLETDVMAVQALKADFSLFPNGFYHIGKDVFIDTTNLRNYSQVLSVKTAVFYKPLQFYGTNANILSSKSVIVEVTDEFGQEIKPEITVKIPNDQAVLFSSHTPLYKENSPNKMLYLKYSSLYDDDATLVYIWYPNFEPENFSSFGLFTVYTKTGDFPTLSDYDYKYDMNIRDWESDEYGFKVFLPQQYTKAGEGYIALDPLEAPNLPSRRRLLALETSTFEVANLKFSSTILTTGCRSYDKAANAWVARGCIVLEISTINETVCRCPDAPGNTFATTFYVPPNKIDFYTVWSKFDPSNAAVYGAFTALIVIYILICVWAHRQDKKDIAKWATYFLCDSDKEDTYFYLITVYTGFRPRAGTNSLVYIVIAGEEFDSGVRILNDGVREGFARGSVVKLLMGSPELLGKLTHLRIWHDNSGNSDNKSWYLYKILIDDVQNQERYVFMCDNWLAADTGDGRIDRLLPVCGKEALLMFEMLFSQHARFNITENHLWVSLFMRPERSVFTRVQRLTCLLALLCLTMVSNAMFFRSADEEASSDTVMIGILSFSPTTIFISLIGILITTPPIYLLTMIFKKSKPRQKHIQMQKASDKQECQSVSNFLNDNITLDQKTMFKDIDFFRTENFPLPHWMTYIAWIVAILVILVSGFFLILYSMEWGKSKSEEWLTTFVLSFFESLTLIDPLKVVVFAFLLSLIFKKPVGGSGPQIDLGKVQEAVSKFSSGSSRSYLALRVDVNGPPTGELLEQFRKKRQLELRARRVFIELVVYLIFAVVLYSISYINRDQQSFIFKDHIVKALVTNTPSRFGFESVKNTDDFFFWCNNTLFRQTFPDTHYNGDPLGARDKQYFFDLANARIGPPRFRMVRMVQGNCPFKNLNWNHSCILVYDEFEEDEDDYCVGWTPNDASNTVCTSPYLFTQLSWKYIKSSEIWGIPITGRYNTYGGGGYIMKLENSIAPSLRQDMLDELRTRKWINRETRAVFVEFTLYNANINLFAYCIFLSEFLETGGLLTWTDINIFRPYQTIGSLGTYALLCYVFYLVCLIFATIKFIIKIKKEKCNFLFSLWNIIDATFVFVSYGGIAIFVCRYIFAKKAMRIYYDDLSKEKFINFQNVVIWDVSFNVVIGLLVFVATIRILRVLGYNKRMTQLAAVLANAWANLAGFSVVFGIVFFAYISFGYLVFGTHLFQYRNMFSSFATLTNSLIGKNSLNDMQLVVPHMAKFFYFTYVLLVLFILMTVFAAVLNQSISEVKHDISKVPEPYGITDLFRNFTQTILSLVSKSSRDQRFSKCTNKEFVPVPGKKRPEIDTQNVLRIVRDTFTEEFQQLTDRRPKKPEESKQQIVNSNDENQFYVNTTESGRGNIKVKNSEPGTFSLAVKTPPFSNANSLTHQL